MSNVDFEPRDSDFGVGEIKSGRFDLEDFDLTNSGETRTFPKSEGNTFRLKNCNNFKNYDILEYLDAIFFSRAFDVLGLASYNVDRNICPTSTGTKLFSESFNFCHDNLLGQSFVKSGRGRCLLQDEDNSGSPPHSFPGLCSGMFPERFRNVSLSVGSREICLI